MLASRVPFAAAEDFSVLYFGKNLGNKVIGWGLKQGMNYNEVTKILKSNGWEFVRVGKGSHMIWRSPVGVQRPIPFHGSKSISPGVINRLNKTL